ncbi:hypothetical protein ACFL3O_00655 [Candidatus Neomarinimicrobiota bacterium]
MFRGFGWDGDSFISAAQYQKLIGSDLYGIIDGGAHPKILSVLLFGIIYQLSGGFYLLTIIAVLLNTLMIITITSWINKEKGLWLFALIGVLINIPWTKIVVNCDNPAFSLPFIIFGLYYISKNKFIEGTTFLTISSLFRSGAEVIIIIILFTQLFNKNLKNSIILGLAFVLAAIHTYWGYLLIYPTKELFWKLSWEFITTPESIAKYQYSLTAFVTYISSVIKQLFNKYSILFIIPSIIGMIKLFKKQNSTRYMLLIPIASLILPISSYIYGTAHEILETKHMGYTILIPILASFSVDRSILEKIGSKTKVFITSGILLLIILFSAFTGNLKQGDYEAHVNGTGIIGWTNFPDIKHDVKSIFPSEKINILTAYQYLTFVTLDIGKYANNIDVIRNATEFDFTTITKYNLIVIPKVWTINLKIISNLGYKIKSNNINSYIYFINEPLVNFVY